MSLAAMLPRALIAWLGRDRSYRQREPAALVLTTAAGAGRGQLGVRQALLPSPRLTRHPRHLNTGHQPELVVDSRLDAINAKREGRADFSSGDWGGAVVTTPASDPPDMVFAQFQVPTVLLQTGIAATATSCTGLFPFFGSVSYWAWTEWWPNGFIVDNLAISPGDAVSVLVCAPQPDHGFVSMENLTTGQIVSVGVDPPAGLTANGPSAEWIIESLSVEAAAFTPWTCVNCQAGSHDSSLTLTGATTLNMADNEVQTTVTSPSSVTITWEKYS